MVANSKTSSRRSKPKRAPQPEPVGLDGLTDKQKAFIEHYLVCWNATEAARRAGYKDPEQAGYENKKKQEIRTLIDQRLTKMAMSADEVLARLSSLAMADMSYFLTKAGRGVKLDLTQALAAGKMHLVKKYNKTKQGTSIELYDAKDALIQLGRYHALFTDRIEHSWRPRIVGEIKARNVTLEELRAEFGQALAEELWREAGLELT